MPYESEILKMLELNKIYTSKDICYFIAFNNYIVLSDEVSVFNKSEDIKFRVINILDMYIHKSENSTINVMPSKKEKIFIVKKVR